MVNFLFSHHHLFGLNHFFFFLCHSYSFFLCPHIFFFIYTVHAGCLYVTDTLSTPTIMEPPSVKCQDLLILCQIKCMYSQTRPRFIVPSERLSNEVQVPCLRGLCNDLQKSCFLLSLPVLPQSVQRQLDYHGHRAASQLPQMLLSGLEPGTFCIQVRRLNHLAKLQLVKSLVFVRI